MLVALTHYSASVYLYEFDSGIGGPEALVLAHEFRAQLITSAEAALSTYP